MLGFSVLAWSIPSFEETVYFLVSAIVGSGIIGGIIALIIFRAVEPETREQIRSHPLAKPVRAIGWSGWFILLLLLVSILLIMQRARWAEVAAGVLIAIAATSVIIVRRDAWLTQERTSRDAAAVRQNLEQRLIGERQRRERSEESLTNATQGLAEARGHLARTESQRALLEELSILHNQVLLLCSEMISGYMGEYSGEKLAKDIHHLIGVFCYHASKIFADQGAGIGISVYRPVDDGTMLEIWNHRDVAHRNLSDIRFYVGSNHNRRREECGLAGESFRSGLTHTGVVFGNLDKDGRVSYSCSHPRFAFIEGKETNPGFRSLITICVKDWDRQPRAVLCIDSQFEETFADLGTQTLAESLGRTLAIPILIHDWVQLVMSPSPDPAIGGNATNESAPAL